MPLMTKFLEGLKGLAAVLASSSALYVAQLYLTPIIASVLGAVLWIANDARWFGTIADAVETVPQETTVSGPARVIDGQRVSVAGTRIYLRGLDVAETGTQWGDMAKWGMEMIAGAELRCHLTGDKFDDPRFRDWEIGYCTRPDGADIAAELVRSGVALACPRVDDRYVRFETDTEAKRLMPQPRSSHCAKQGAS